MSDSMICRVCLLLTASLWLQGCVESRPTMLGAPIEGINHTSAAINGFSVNRNGGHNIGPFGGGGTQMCCAVLPLQWRKGLTVVVEWEKDPLPHDYGNWLEPLFSDAWSARMKVHQSKYTRHSAVVEVAPYQELGVITVHFLPCDQVKVAADTTYDGLAEHPYQYPRRMEVPSTCPTDRKSVV